MKKKTLMTACDAKEVVESIDYCTGKGCKLHIYFLHLILIYISIFILTFTF